MNMKQIGREGKKIQGRGRGREGKREAVLEGQWGWMYRGASDNRCSETWGIFT